MHIRKDLVALVMVCLPLKMQAGEKPNWMKLGGLSLEVITCNEGKET